MIRDRNYTLKNNEQLEEIFFSDDVSEIEVKKIIFELSFRKKTKATKLKQRIVESYEVQDFDELVDIFCNNNEEDNNLNNIAESVDTLNKEFEESIESYNTNKPTNQDTNRTAVNHHLPVDDDDLFDYSISTLKFVNTKNYDDSTEIDWRHGQDESGEYKGFNDSSLEHFPDPVLGLVKELTQNSLDARLEDDTPVIIEINLNNIPTNEIPNKDSLYLNISKALKTYRDRTDNPDKKIVDFYENALGMLDDKTIPVLEFSDFNTTGMSQNSSDLDDIFYTYMKTSFHSNKSDKDTLGSFGIGKAAPYAASGLRAVLVSSVYENSEGNAYQVCQGKAALISIANDENSKQYLNANGYWGITDNLSELSGYCNQLSASFQRVKDEMESDVPIGSTINVLGYIYSQDWVERISFAVYQNFFDAINSNRLIFKINHGDIELNKKTIRNIRHLVDINKVSKYGNDYVEALEERGYYLNALIGSENTFKESISVKHLGKCELYITINENYPKKICYIRDGMFITDSVDWRGLKRFSQFKDFVIVFKCLESSGNKLINEMEPPAHDNLQPDRSKDSVKRKMGIEAFDDLRNKIKKCLEKYAYEMVEESAYVNELEEFFGDNSDSENLSNSDNNINEINPYGKIKIKLKTVPAKNQRRTTNTNNTEKEDIEVVTPGGEGGPGTIHTKTGTHGGGDDSNKDGTEIVKGEKIKETEVKNFRFVNSDGDIQLAFDYKKDAKLKIRLNLAGIDEDLPLNIISSSEGEICKDGTLEIPVVKNSRNKVKVSLKDFDFGALKVEAYEIK